MNININKINKKKYIGFLEKINSKNQSDIEIIKEILNINTDDLNKHSLELKFIKKNEILNSNFLKDLFNVNGSKTTKKLDKDNNSLESNNLTFNTIKDQRNLINYQKKLFDTVNNINNRINNNTDINNNKEKSENISFLKDLNLELNYKSNILNSETKEKNIDLDTNIKEKEIDFSLNDEIKEKELDLSLQEEIKEKIKSNNNLKFEKNELIEDSKINRKKSNTSLEKNNNNYIKINSFSSRNSILKSKNKINNLSKFRHSKIVKIKSQIEINYIESTIKQIEQKNKKKKFWFLCC